MKSLHLDTMVECNTHADNDNCTILRMKYNYCLFENVIFIE